MKYFLNPLISILIVCTGSFVFGDRCPRPWIFSDLGNTLVDTKTRDPKTGDYVKVFYRPGAFDYLNSLRVQGYPVGAIINIPEVWGKSYDEKLNSLKNFIGAIWYDPNESKLDWSRFNAGIYLPASDLTRKPARDMFCAAARDARKAGCMAVYQGEDDFHSGTGPLEVVMASKKAGLAGFYVHAQTSYSTPEGFLATEKIDLFLKDNPPVEAIDSTGAKFCDGI
jgi:hypothetical protein